MKKKLGIILGLIGICTMFIGCSNNKTIENSDKIKVIVSINPIKEFAEKIGGDKVEVTTLVPNGVEPHDFDPKPKDLEFLGRSSIFIYNGLGMEEWIDSILSTIEDKDVIVVNSSKGANVNKIDNKVDPHLWLSLKEAINQGENIKSSLIEKDPDNRVYYEENFNNFAKELNDLYDEYSVKFKNVTSNKFVTGHAAFGYLCREFGLEQESIQDIYGEEGEVTARQLEELVKLCRENNIKVIFSEALSSSKASETLANEVGVKVEKIYTLESSEDGLTYLDGMRYNLEKVYESLK